MADAPELFGGPPAVDQSGNLTIWWVPGGVADKTKPKLTELATATRLTYSFTSDGWSFDATTEKLKDDRLTSPQSRESLGRTTPTFSDLKYVDSKDPKSAAVILKAGGRGDFIERRNIAQTALGTIGDPVRVLSVNLGDQLPGPTAGDGKFNLKQSVAVEGIIGAEVLLVA